MIYTKTKPNQNTNMSNTLTLRYSKNSEYGDHVFICTDDEEAFPSEQEGFKELKRMSAKLNEMFTTFLPVYHSEEHNYCSIRFQKTNSKFHRRSLYKVSFDIKRKSKDGQEYCNAYIKKVKLHTRVKEDQGKIIEI